MNTNSTRYLSDTRAATRAYGKKIIHMQLRGSDSEIRLWLCKNHYAPFCEIQIDNLFLTDSVSRCQICSIGHLQVFNQVPDVS